MAFWDFLKVNRKTFINPSAWMDLPAVKQNTQTVVELFKVVFRRENAPPPRKESFEEMLRRLNISNEEANKISNDYLTFSIIFVLAACVVVAAGIYFLFDGYFLGFLLSLGISAVMLSQAFRFHFWHFQIKHRKLGCTFEEWRTGTINKETST